MFPIILYGDFVVISRAEFEGILGAVILHLWKRAGAPKQACAGVGGIEVEER